MTNTKKTARMSLLPLLLVLAATILFLPATEGLSINVLPAGNHTVPENSTLFLTLTAENTTGTTTFSKNSEKGTLVKINDTTAEYSWTPSFGDAGTSSKTYEIDFSVQDSETNTQKKTWITVTKVNNPFTITEKTGGGMTHENTNVFHVKTDRPQTTCKYDVSSKTYENMQYTMAPENHDKTRHKGTISFSSDGQHIVYIRCKDALNNQLEQPATFLFDVLLRPKAKITLVPPSPVRDGLIEIRLTTTKPLIKAPEVTYSFSSDTTKNTVTMIGSQTSWTGYMVISKSDEKKVGTFEFKGLATNNMEGTDIIDGKIFIVDTSRPSEVISVQVEGQQSRIRLAWHYPDTETDQIIEYRIYRKVGGGGTDYVDYYASAEDMEFYDVDVEYEQAYYYRISAVKETGVEGPLSREVFITHLPSIPASSAPESLDPALSFELKEKEEALERILFDISSIERQLERELGEKGEAIRTLNLLGDVRTQKDKVNALKEELLTLENKDLSRADFNRITSRILDESLDYFLNTPVDIEILGSTTYQEFTDDDKTTSIISKYLESENINMTMSQTSNFLTDMRPLQDTILVQATNILVNVKYPEHEKKFAIIKKSVAASDPLSSSALIEEISPQLVERLADIKFSSSPSLFESHSLATWKMSSLNTFTLTYYFNTDASFDQLRNTKTIVIQDSVEELRQNAITGMATDVPEGESSGLVIPTIIAVALLSILITYYIYTNHASSPVTEKAKKGLNSLRSRLKSRKMSIVPKKRDDSHMRLDFNHEDIHKNTSKTRADLKGHEKKSSDETNEAVLPVTQETTQENELEYLKLKLEEYQKKLASHESIPPKKIKELHDAIIEIKLLCEEIHQENIYEHAQKTKEELEETLKQIEAQRNKEGKLEAQAKGQEDEELPTISVSVHAPEGTEFRLFDGSLIRNVEELKELLLRMEDSSYYHHVQEHNNDFSNWLSHVFGEEDLAEKVRGAKNKEEAAGIISEWLKAMSQ